MSSCCISNKQRKGDDDNEFHTLLDLRSAMRRTVVGHAGA